MERGALAEVIQRILGPLVGAAGMGGGDEAGQGEGRGRDDAEPKGKRQQGGEGQGHGNRRFDAGMIGGRDSACKRVSAFRSARS